MPVSVDAGPLVTVSGVTLATTRVGYDSTDAQVLIGELQSESTERYGGPDETPVDPSEFAHPNGAFFVARFGVDLVGCVGVRRHSESDAELKRMFIRRQFRRRGWSRELLTLVEGEARALGFTRMILETGLAQPEAMHLYESSGYEPIPGFGHYRAEPLNRCFAKKL
jgi:GNAT superfamily N-acetyltransferase